MKNATLTSPAIKPAIAPSTANDQKASANDKPAMSLPTNDGVKTGRKPLPPVLPSITTDVYFLDSLTDALEATLQLGALDQSDEDLMHAQAERLQRLYENIDGFVERQVRRLARLTDVSD